VKEKEEEMHLPKVNVAKFFTTQEERDEEKLEKVQEISIKEIEPFPEHPFKVRDDEKMFETVDSIKEHGVLVPAIIRIKDGKYQMVAGHRRQRACELAQKETMPCIIRNLTDEQATIIMVDSNLQREQILPSERAFAYKMKLDAIKRQGERNDLTSTQVVQKLSVEVVADEMGESREKIRRYVRLTYLTEELLELVDNQYLKLKDKLQMSLAPAVEISYLTKNEQDILFEAMEETVVTPSTPQAKRLREESENGTLTEEKIYEVLDEEKPNQKEQVKVPDEELQPYYPKEVVSAEQKRKYIIHCVRKISELEEKQRQRKLEYAR